MEKKTWVTPELIVLVRSKPEEAVLTACKSSQTNEVGVFCAICQATKVCIALIPS